MAGEEEQTMLENEITSYREAFALFDWNKNGRVPYSYLLDAMRRAGANPTESEVQDIVNKLEMNNDALTADDFCRIMLEANQEVDSETSYKETFRAFSKDEDGCIPAEEVKFVLKLLPVGFDIQINICLCTSTPLPHNKNKPTCALVAAMSTVVTKKPL